MLSWQMETLFFHLQSFNIYILFIWASEVTELDDRKCILLTK